MRFVKGAEVFTVTGEKIGTINRVIIDAKTRDVTDLVLERGLFGSEKVVPIGLVDLEKEDKLTLRETNQSVDDFSDYETTQYVPIDQMDDPSGTMESYYWYPPVGFQTPVAGVFPEYVLRTEKNIPEGRVAIAEGAQVVSGDKKHIGNIEQVIADSESNNVTHFVVGKGFLLKDHKLVPALWVTNVADGKVYLSVEARVFDRLPDYQPD